MTLDELLVALGLLLTGVGVGLAVFPVLESRRRRAGQVREVTARIERIWDPVGGDPHHRILTGGEFTIVNGSPWPVREITVLQPSWMNKLDIPYLGPHDTYKTDIPLSAIFQAGAEEITVELQIQDDRRKLWQWTPSTSTLKPVPRGGLHHTRA